MEAPSGSLRDVRRAERPGGDFHPALSLLQEAVAAYPADEVRSWLTSVRRALAAAQEAFRLHVEATERAGGFLDEIVRVAPRLEGRARRLRNEHVEIQDAIARVLEMLDPRVAELPEVLSSLVGRLAHHCGRGADLAWDAYEIDLGGEG